MAHPDTVRHLVISSMRPLLLSCPKSKFQNVIVYSTRLERRPRVTGRRTYSKTRLRTRPVKLCNQNRIVNRLGPLAVRWIYVEVTKKNCRMQRCRSSHLPSTRRALPEEPSSRTAGPNLKRIVSTLPRGRAEVQDTPLGDVVRIGTCSRLFEEQSPGYVLGNEALGDSRGWGACAVGEGDAGNTRDAQPDPDHPDNQELQ